MRKTKNTNKTVLTKKSRIWIWVIVAFVFGFVVGYATHYLITNWNNFFAVCSDGNKPDAKGCCPSLVSCPNGESPDKNGCCDGEIYTDAGGGWMVCCPDGGDNCFPPVDTCVLPIKK